MTNYAHKCGSCIYFEKYETKKKGKCLKNRKMFSGVPMSTPKCKLYKNKKETSGRE